MKNQIVCLAVSTLLFALCQSTEAQQPVKVHRIGLLILASDVIAPFTDAFRQGLRDLGGKTLRA
jgi:hypothetical protein